MTNPWIRVSRPYNGGELVLMVHRTNGKQSVQAVNQWGEVSTPLWNTAIIKLVEAMRASLAV